MCLGPGCIVSAVVKKSTSSARARALPLAAALLLAAALAGCGLTLPFESRTAALTADPEITGSIGPSKRSDAAAANASPFSPTLDQEDWRRQRAALATALDPQGNGGLVRWENPDSGAKGSFAPVGDAFLLQHDICRTFVAYVIEKGKDGKADGTAAEDWRQGSACRTGPGEWSIREVKPWKRPA